MNDQTLDQGNKKISKANFKSKVAPEETVEQGVLTNAQANMAFISGAHFGLLTVQIPTKDGDDIIKLFSPPTEYTILMHDFLLFLERVKGQSRGDYTIGLGVRMGKASLSNPFNIGLEPILYKKSGGEITNYQTLKTGFFGRLITSFGTNITNQKAFQDSLRITDNRASKYDPLKIGPARIAVVELLPLNNFINDIKYDEHQDVISFAFGRAKDERITVVISVKQMVGGNLTMIKPNTNPDYAYLDVHDLIPPPDAES